MKKVCFVIPRAYEYFFPGIKPVGGGAEKQIFLLSKGLSNYKYFDINVCLADFGQDKFMQKNNISFWRIHKLSDNKLIGLIKIIKTLKQVGADVYIFMAANSAIYILSWYIKFILKKKVVYMMASDAEIKFSTLKRHAGLITSVLMQQTNKLVDLLIVQNQEQLITQHKRKNKPTVLIPNPIERVADDFDIDFANKSGTLWVGRLDPIKQPELLIKMANHFPDEKFTMIAPIVPEYEQYGESIVRTLSNSPNIRYIKYVANNEILQYYKQVKVYAMTSEQEGFSNTMMEAMMCKCAVLSLNVNPNGLFSTNEKGLYSQGDFDLFINNFEQLLDNNDLAHKLGQNAHNYIVDNHQLETVVEKFADNLAKI